MFSNCVGVHFLSIPTPLIPRVQAYRLGHYQSTGSFKLHEAPFHYISIAIKRSVFKKILQFPPEMLFINKQEYFFSSFWLSFNSAPGTTDPELINSCWVELDLKFCTDPKYHIKDKSSNSLHHENRNLSFVLYNFGVLRWNSAIYPSLLANYSSYFRCIATPSRHILEFEKPLPCTTFSGLIAFSQFLCHCNFHSFIIPNSSHLLRYRLVCLKGSTKILSINILRNYFPPVLISTAKWVRVLRLQLSF